ncbi:MAG TPA: TolC family protein, partial [Rubricoccaceae bacterium]
MRRALFLTALALAALAAPSASAQTPDSIRTQDSLAVGPTVTIAEAVRIALDRSPDLARAAVADRSAALAVRSAQAERLPSLALQVSPAQQLGLAFDQTTGQLTSQSVQTVNLGVGADVRLFDGRRARYAVEGARLDREAAAVGVERTEQQVALDVAQRFLQLLLDRELVRVQAGQLAAAESPRAQVSGLVEGGARARGDLLAQ